MNKGKTKQFKKKDNGRISNQKYSAQSSIQICLRMRPLLNQYEDQDAWNIDKQTNSIFSLQKPVVLTNLHLFNNMNQNLSMMKRRYADAYYNYSFSYDYVFGPQDSTEKIYKESCRGLVDNILKGYNCTVFMYGQTTSGKTFTMLGDIENPGILPFSLHDIFQQINQLKKQGYEFQLLASYLQIYNEQINDLLCPGSVNLKIHQDSQHGIVVQGLKICEVEDFNQAILIMKFGEEQRSYKQRDIHDHSSRSHTIFQLKLKAKINSNYLNSCLNLVDLAGSQRLHDEQTRTDNDQTGYINKSLFILSNVINKLAEGKKNNHIPYRDSKLTRFLSNSLGGNSMTAIICTISPAAMNFYQTLSTLRFAQRAKKIYNKPIINQIKNKQTLKEIQELKAVLTVKEEEISQLLRQKALLQKQIDESSNQENNPRKDLKKIFKQNSQNVLYQMQKNIEKMLTQKYKGFKQSNSIGQWSQKSLNLIEEYQENIQVLQQKYKRALLNLTQKQFPTLSAPQKDISNSKQLQNIILKIDNGKIFNDLFVNSILNPEADIEIAKQQQQEYVSQVKQAYEQAVILLKNKYEQYKRLNIPRDKLIKLSSLFSNKMMILQSAFQDVIKKLNGQ